MIHNVFTKRTLLLLPVIVFFGTIFSLYLLQILTGKQFGIGLAPLFLFFIWPLIGLNVILLPVSYILDYKRGTYRLSIIHTFLSVAAILTMVDVNDLLLVVGNLFL